MDYTRETVLYEIAMAIGESLSLAPMCRTALEAFVKKLSASSGAIVGRLERDLQQENWLIASIPRRIGDMSAYHDLVADLQNQRSGGFRHALVGEQHLYAFRLEDRGFLLLRCRHPLDELIIRSLPPLLRKLSTSMQACRDAERLEESLTAAQKSERAKTTFLANMSHEIRTPMNAILGFVQLLSASEQDPGRQKQFDIIKNSGNNLLNIINDILDLSKIESGNLTLEQHPFALTELIRETHSLFKVMAADKQIDLQFMRDDDLPVTVTGDSVRIKQILYNLLSNAIKFTPEQGRVRVTASYDRSRSELRFVVEDTGIGISEENQQRIFEAFVQEDDSTTRRYGGTGLGLSITSRLVKLMDGNIEVSSAPGIGSRFSFVIGLPCMDREEAQPGSGANAGAQSQVSLCGRVLVVEDNDNNQTLISILLEQQGLAYDIANDGQEALKMVGQNHYDLILMDEDMPVMNGIEATRQLREIEATRGSGRTPIIAVTASAMKGDRQRFIDAGMDDYLSKPYRHEDMIGTLQAYLAKR